MRKNATLRGVTLGAAIFAALVQVACSAKESTAGKRVAFQTIATVDPEALSGFTTAVGWNVKLSRAAVAIGALHYFDGEPAVAHRDAPARGPLERFAMLVEGVAHAHPGHYQAGTALGEFLEPSSLDLLRTPAVLGRGDGVSGTFRSARFTFADKAVGSAARELASNVALAEGVATKSDAANAREIHFRLSAQFDDVTANVTRGEVDGCEFATTDVEGDGTITLTVNPRIWLDLVDFSDVAEGTSAAPTQVAEGETAQIGFALGLVQLTAYRFAFSG
jgi:hypothetical protein